MMWKIFLHEKGYVGKFNVILVGAASGPQKSEFLYGKTLYLGTSCLGGTVLCKLVCPEPLGPKSCQPLQFS